MGKLFVENPRLKSVPVLDENESVAGIIKSGASEVATLLSDVTSGDMIILGDREYVQKELLAIGNVCLVLTRNTAVSEEIIRLAKEKDDVIIVTPFDSYKTARLINQSIPVKLLMTKPVVCFNETDLLADVKQKILSAKYVTYPVLRKGKYIGVIDRGMMLEPERQQVILVDHNERSQAVEGIEETQILEIIAHHLPGVLSRKKQVIPPLTEAFKRVD